MFTSNKDKFIDAFLYKSNNKWYAGNPYVSGNDKMICDETKEEFEPIFPVHPSSINDSLFCKKQVRGRQLNDLPEGITEETMEDNVSYRLQKYFKIEFVNPKDNDDFTSSLVTLAMTKAVQNKTNVNKELNELGYELTKIKIEDKW